MFRCFQEISRPCLADRNSLLSILENVARWREALMFGEDNGGREKQVAVFCFFFSNSWGSSNCSILLKWQCFYNKSIYQIHSEAINTCRENWWCSFFRPTLCIRKHLTTNPCYSKAPVKHVKFVANVKTYIDLTITPEVRESYQAVGNFHFTDISLLVSFTILYRTVRRSSVGIHWWVLARKLHNGPVLFSPGCLGWRFDDGEKCESCNRYAEVMTWKKQESLPAPATISFVVSHTSMKFLGWTDPQWSTEFGIQLVFFLSETTSFEWFVGY